MRDGHWSLICNLFTVTYEVKAHWAWNLVIIATAEVHHGTYATPRTYMYIAHDTHNLEAKLKTTRRYCLLKPQHYLTLFVKNVMGKGY